MPVISRLSNGEGHVVCFRCDAKGLYHIRRLGQEGVAALPAQAVQQAKACCGQCNAGSQQQKQHHHKSQR